MSYAPADSSLIRSQPILTTSKYVSLLADPCYTNAATLATAAGKALPPPPQPPPF